MVVLLIPKPILNSPQKNNRSPPPMPTKPPAPDIQLLITTYAQSTSTLTFPIVYKSNNLPPQSAPILALNPIHQAQAALLLMQHVAQAYNPGNKSIMWWNHIVTAPPYAGPAILLHALLRKKLPFTHDQLIALVEPAARLRINQTFAAGEPTEKILKLVELNLADQKPIPPKLKSALQKLASRLGPTAPDAKSRAIIARLLA
jgi:hypothetical protein